MAELFFILGQEKSLEDEITPLALEKRKLFEAKKRESLQTN
jgi:hypothetical protein